MAEPAWRLNAAPRARTKSNHADQNNSNGPENALSSCFRAFVMSGGGDSGDIQLTDQSVSVSAFVSRRFYIGLGLFMVAMVAAGFSPYFGQVLSGTVDKDFIVHLHATVYVGWIALFITQASLAATGRLALHQKLGKAAIYYGVFIFIVGLVASVHQLADGIAAGEVERAQRFFLVPLVDMVLFPAFFGAAIAYRKTPEIHKRLMLVATVTLMNAPAGRLDMEAFMAMSPSYLVVWLSPVIIAMVYDYWKQRRVHPVYFIGAAVLVISAFRMRVLQADAWLDISRQISALVN